MASPFLSWLPLYIAIERGFFAEEGIEIELIRLEGGSAAIPALIQGDVDVIGNTTNASTLNAIARGANIRIVADLLHWDDEGCTGTGLLVSPELIHEGELADAGQLAGLRLSADTINPEAYYIERLLGTYGLTLADMRIDELPSAVVGEALASGSIDLANTSEPWLTRITESGTGVLWKGAREIAPDFQFANLVFGPNLLQTDRDAGARFLRAWLRGVRQFNEGKTAANLEIAAGITGLDPELLQAMCWSSVHPEGAINSDSILDFQAWLAGKGLIERILAAEEFWDGSFSAQALEGLQP